MAAKISTIVPAQEEGGGGGEWPSVADIATIALGLAGSGVINPPISPLSSSSAAHNILLDSYTLANYTTFSISLAVVLGLTAGPLPVAAFRGANRRRVMGVALGFTIFMLAVLRALLELVPWA